MKEIIVYVEGPSDQLGMRELLSSVMELAHKNGDSLDFFPLNGKEPLLNKGPIKALNILRNRRSSYVFLVPDLYPKNKPFPHVTYDEMRNRLRDDFNRELQRKGCDSQLSERFFVHCFKYDLESLVLASETALLSRLGKQKFSQEWVKPVENQDHNNPPKRIVEALFLDADMRYKDTADVPWIFQRSSYRDLAEKCSQNFKPLIEDLLRILGTEAS